MDPKSILTSTIIFPKTFFEGILHIFGLLSSSLLFTNERALHKRFSFIFWEITPRRESCNFFSGDFTFYLLLYRVIFKEAKDFPTIFVMIWPGARDRASFIPGHYFSCYFHHQPCSTHRDLFGRTFSIGQALFHPRHFMRTTRSVYPKHNKGSHNSTAAAKEDQNISTKAFPLSILTNLLNTKGGCDFYTDYINISFYKWQILL